jgi:hypothetical protein
VVQLNCGQAVKSQQKELFGEMKVVFKTSGDYLRKTSEKVLDHYLPFILSFFDFFEGFSVTLKF